MKIYESTLIYMKIIHTYSSFGSFSFLNFTIVNLFPLTTIKYEFDC